MNHRNHRETQNMEETKVNFGIMGCAKIAKKLARAINSSPNSTLYAIASRSLQKAKDFATNIGISETIKTYGSYDDLLDDPLVDVVYMPLPTSLHVYWGVLAAKKKKHLLMEKPTAVDVKELDKILEACEINGVQFMDGSMWLHHPQTAKLKELISDPKLIGGVNILHSTATSLAPAEFLENDIRVKPDLDALGALGDLGWYCIGAILWAKDYQLPSSVTALPDTSKNSSGVILTCTASLQYDQDKTVGIMHCSFLSHVTTDFTIVGSNGSLHLTDFIIPYREDSASFDFTWLAKLVNLHIGWSTKPETIVVPNEVPQEVLMVQEVSRLVHGIKTSMHPPGTKWPEISRKTQLVLDAVRKSIDLGFKPVHLNELA